jgi:hypothetical protein
MAQMTEKQRELIQRVEYGLSLLFSVDYTSPTHESRFVAFDF